MDSLPLEILLEVGKSVPPRQRPRLLRVCRAWTTLFTPLVYSSLDLTGSQIAPLVQSIKDKPSLAPRIKHLTMSALGSSAELKGRAIEKSTWQVPFIKTLMADRREPELARMWRNGLAELNGDFWAAVLLFFLHGLETLRIEPVRGSWTRNVIMLAFMHRPPFASADRPGPRNLKKLEFLQGPTNELLVLEQDLFGFLRLPNLKSVHVRGAITPRSVEPITPPKPNGVESITLEAKWTGAPFAMPHHIKVCTKLKSFSFTNTLANEEDGPRDCMLREHFFKPLAESQKENLELLDLNYRGIAYDDIFDPAEDRGEMHDSEPYDRFMGSFRDFKNLKDLAVRAPNLCDIRFTTMDDAKLLTPLVDVLPRSIENLSISFTVSIQLDPVFTGLSQLLAARDQFPSLKSVTVAYQSVDGRIMMYARHSERTIQLESEVYGFGYADHDGDDPDDHFNNPHFLYTLAGQEWAAEMAAAEAEARRRAGGGSRANAPGAGVSPASFASADDPGDWDDHDECTGLWTNPTVVFLFATNQFSQHHATFTSAYPRPSSQIVMHLPREIIRLIGEALEPNERPKLLLVCRRWRSTLSKLVYSAVELQGCQIPFFVHSIEDRPKAFSRVKELTLPNRASVPTAMKWRTPEDPTWIDRQMARFADSMDQSTIEEWREDLLRKGNNEWAALLISLLRKLVVLHIEPLRPEIVRRVLYLAGTRQPPFDKKKALHKLEKIAFLLLEHVDLCPDQDLFMFFSLPSIRSIHVRGRIDPALEIEAKPPPRTKIEEIRLDLQWSEPFGLPAYIRSCENLKRFSFTNQYNQEERAPDDCDFRTEFYEPLLSQKHNLEVLDLNYRGTAYDDLYDLQDGQEERFLAHHVDPDYDRWMGSFAGFECLKELSIRAPNLLDIRVDRTAATDSALRTALSECLPRSLECLSISITASAQLRAVSQGLIGVSDARYENVSQFPNLRKVTVAFQTDDGRVKCDPRHARVMEGLKSHFRSVDLEFEIIALKIPGRYLSYHKMGSIYDVPEEEDERSPEMWDSDWEPDINDVMTEEFLDSVNYDFDAYVDMCWAEIERVHGP
ncbi:F-box protein [Aspergillus mulundensis]|uniref:F-box domain-containing protein n=1 Tax=Aspergillus mulundensis TaxID=1810919 RepID=A0A3D8T323_9EURO|nr:hypothetical protein DSM5745_00279 [Aspergillus mulundensis]RDW92957.1 hypothetical protein DSM5745_00279 [Aspergillus mulundensis]